MDSKDDCSVLHYELEESVNENTEKHLIPSCNSNVLSPIIPGEETELPIVTNPLLEPQVETKLVSTNESSVIVKKDSSVTITPSENPEDWIESNIISTKSELQDGEYYCNNIEKGETKVKVKPLEIFCDPSSSLTSNTEKINTDKCHIHKPPLLDQTDNSLPIQDTFDATPCRGISKNYVFQDGVTCTSTPLNEQQINKGMKTVFDNLSIIKEEEESLLDVSKELVVKPTEHEILPQIRKEGVNTESENELSVFRKDELSLLIDIPNERILSEKKIDVNNHHLTLPVKDSESVTYKNVFDKTVDDLLIEGNNFDKINELCNLEVESDRKEILNKAVSLKPFVSSNADENRDNNDPEWELLKKLETDDERYKAVRTLWRNLAIPDLKQNHSTFNWRKKNSLPTLKNIVPIKTNEIGRRKKNLIYECTEVFDVGIKKLEDFCHRQYQGIKLEEDNETSIMASLNKKPRLDIGPSHVAKRDYQTEFDKISVCFQERLQRHLEAKQEIKAVHGFYNGLKNQGNGGYGNVMYISHKERQHILEIESMINHYTIWYP